MTDDAVLVALGVTEARAGPRPSRGSIRSRPVWSWVPLWFPEGRPGPSVAGRSYDIGTLFRQSAGTARRAVLRAPCGRPGDAEPHRVPVRRCPQPVQPVTLRGADLLTAPRSADRSLLDRLPDLAGVAEHRLGDQVLRLRQAPAAANTVSSVLAETPRTSAPLDAAGRGTVRGPAGGAMAVVGVPVTPGSNPPIYFVSSGGVAFLLKNEEAAAALKINQVRPAPFPQELLAGLPQGPTLSREAVTVFAEG